MVAFGNPLKKCKSCGKTFSDYGNTCYWCMTGIERPKEKFKGLCYKKKEE